LKNLEIRFARKATVCKYITPPNYGFEAESGVPIKLDLPEIESLGVRAYFAKLSEKNGQLLTTTSRSVALLGIGDSIEKAEMMVEEALLHYVHGRYHIRHDIGKLRLIQNTGAKEMQSVA
jgi:phosphoribosylamine--glycine ligase